MTEQWFEIKAWNQITMYGFGSAADAEIYVDLLNGNHEINLYYADVMLPEDCVALDSGDDTDGFRLDEAIDTIREYISP